MSDVRLSKTMSHALRHQPWLYELELDAEGWTPMSALAVALRVPVDRLRDVVATNDKQRFELADDRIRARYGHSVPGRILKEPGVPPPVLYHGTATTTAAAILREGLRPMRRQYAHLSVTHDMATSVGRRKGEQVRVLRVDATAAAAAGVEFLRGNELVWLVTHVPAEFLS